MTASLTQNSNLKSQSASDQPFLTIENVSKVYQTQKGPYTVLEGVNLTIQEGEFICIIGHSGCGKSTLLNMVAGFNQPSEGELRLKGERITEPGPDRMVVFQNYSLLPWLSASENIHLGVETVFADKPRIDQMQIVKEHLELVGLTEAANKKPGQLSGGMKQRVAIARALATRPQVLILDEPFGALDPITREELQEELLKIWREHKVTVLMITHDIDEALFLADRVVMMTNGPAAHIGEELKVPFSRPRNRSKIMEDPHYYELRNFALDFLFRRFAHSEEDEAGAASSSASSSQASAENPATISTEKTAEKSGLTPSEQVTQGVNPTNGSKDVKASPSLFKKRAALMAFWAAGAVGLTGVNLALIAHQQKDNPKIQVNATALNAAPPSEPPAPALSPATTAAPAPDNIQATTAAPAPDNTQATTIASPAPDSTQAPSADSTTTVNASPAPDSTDNTQATPADSATTVNALTDKTEIEALGQKLYDTIDQSWKVSPAYTKTLVYRVNVAEDGRVVQYEPAEYTARDFAKDTPLPELQKTGASQPLEGQKTAEFRVTFSPAGVLEVTPW